MLVYCFAQHHDACPHLIQSSPSNPVAMREHNPKNKIAAARLLRRNPSPTRQPHYPVRLYTFWMSFRTFWWSNFRSLSRPSWKPNTQPCTMGNLFSA